MKLSFPIIKENITHFFGRYHYLIFFVLVVTGLSVSMFILNQTIVASDNTNGYTPNTAEVEFDTAAINKLRELRNTDEQTSQLDFSNGRINPF